VTLKEVLARSAGFLERKGVDSPRLAAELLLGSGLGLTRLELYTQHDRPMTPRELEVVRELVARRGRREPLAYILGEWGFRRLTLKTDARALVPRPETEVVVERALAAVAAVEAPRVADVGTGSGAIALAIASERPDARVVATDVSAGALALARENAERLGLEVELVRTDLLAGVPGPFDLVVSNPPYVLPEELGSLEAEVREWEPAVALVDVGQSAALAPAAAEVLVPGGRIVLECHAEHASRLATTVAAAGFAEVRIARDIAGRDRVVEGRWEATTSSER
jgi:release factor glutamine methyltransferase